MLVRGRRRLEILRGRRLEVVLRRRLVEVLRRWRLVVVLRGRRLDKVALVRCLVLVRGNLAEVVLGGRLVLTLGDGGRLIVVLLNRSWLLLIVIIRLSNRLLHILLLWIPRLLQLLNRMRVLGLVLRLGEALLEDRSGDRFLLWPLGSRLRFERMWLGHVGVVRHEHLLLFRLLKYVVKVGCFELIDDEVGQLGR